MSELGTGILTVLGAIIGVAIISVLVSNNAQTGSVIQAGGKAFSGIIGAAVAPVTGNNLYAY